MAEFTWVWNEIGVRPDNGPFRSEKTVPVPLHRQTLVLLRGAKGAKQQAIGGKLDVTEVDPDLLLAHVHSYVGLDIYNLSADDQKDLLSRIYPPVQLEVADPGNDFRPPPSKLLVVKGNLPGKTTLKAGDATQDVEVFSPNRYTVSFRFLQPPKGVSDPSLSLWTKRKRSEVVAWISKLNWIFGSQANITFRLGTAEVFWSHDALTSKIRHEDMADNFANLNPKEADRDHRDNNSNFTVFLTGVVNYNGDPQVYGATYHPDDGGSWVTVIADHPSYSYCEYPDQFIPVLAHELSHAIRKDYADFNDDPEGISSTKKQNTKIGPLLRDALLHPPGSK
jgi:hypothetical protein